MRVRVDNQPEITDAGIPAWISVSCKDSEHLCSGEPLSELADLVNAYLAKGVSLLAAVGINCTPPHFLREVSPAVLVCGERDVDGDNGEDKDNDKEETKTERAIETGGTSNAVWALVFV